MKELLIITICLLLIFTVNFIPKDKVEKEIVSYETTMENNPLKENVLINDLIKNQEFVKEEKIVASVERTAIVRKEVHIKSEEYLLAQLIHWEARGEPMEGKLAVGAVVLNRVKSSQFPNTIEGVIFQSNQFSGVTRTGSFLSTKPSSDCLEAAKRALSGYSPVRNAKYFLNQNIVLSNRGELPSWVSKLTFVKRIGDHWFYE